MSFFLTEVRSYSIMLEMLKVRTFTLPNDILEALVRAFFCSSFFIVLVAVILVIIILFLASTLRFCPFLQMIILIILTSGNPLKLSLFNPYKVSQNSAFVPKKSWLFSHIQEGEFIYSPFSGTPLNYLWDKGTF